MRRVAFPAIRCLLAVMLITVTVAHPARATLLPPPMRLALLFERTPWTEVEPAAAVPPGHIVVLWER